MEWEAGFNDLLSEFLSKLLQGQKDQGALNGRRAE